MGRWLHNLSLGMGEKKEALKNKLQKEHAADKIAINHAAQNRRAQGGFKSCEIPKHAIFLFFLSRMHLLKS